MYPRRIAIALVFVVAYILTLGHSAAQQDIKVPRIGVILNDRPGPLFDSVRQSFASLGYIEGQNVVFEGRFARGQLDRVPEIAAELVRLNVDVIVSLGAVGAEAAQKVSKTIPIVFVGAIEPVAAGFAARLERPGGNVTGITSFDPQQAPKQLQILKQVIPNLDHVTFLTDEDIPRVDGWATVEKANDTAARALGMRPQWLKLKGPAPDVDAMFTAMTNERAEALVVLDAPVPIIHQKEIAGLAVGRRLPTMFLGGRRMAGSGGLIAYGTGLLDTLPRIPVYVDKILKGAKPADLPIEVVTRHVLIINLKTAQDIGVTIPSELLKQADQVLQ